MAIGIMQQIIRKNVSDQIVLNIMDLKNPNKIWDKLRSICIEVDQKIIYSIFQKLFHYSKITKPKGYKKLVIQVFAKIKYLYKYLQIAMTLKQDL